MEKLFSEMLGMPVIAESDGHILGRVMNILIHPDNGQILAFSLDFSFGKIVLPVDVRGIFREMIVREDDIASSDDVVRISEVLERDCPVYATRVVAKNGKFLGRVFDYSVNIDMGMMTNIFVAKSFLGLVRWNQRIFSFSNILEIKPKKIVVRSDVAEARVGKFAVEGA